MIDKSKNKQLITILATIVIIVVLMGMYFLIKPDTNGNTDAKGFLISVESADDVSGSYGIMLVNDSIAYHVMFKSYTGTTIIETYCDSNFELNGENFYYNSSNALSDIKSNLNIIKNIINKTEFAQDNWNQYWHDTFNVDYYEIMFFEKKDLNSTQVNDLNNIIAESNFESFSDNYSREPSLDSVSFQITIPEYHLAVTTIDDEELSQAPNSFYELNAHLILLFFD